MNKKDNKIMGVSQWKAIGKEYGYWDYFKKEVAEEIRGKLPEKKLVKGETIEWSDGYLHCLQEVQNLLTA